MGYYMDKSITLVNNPLKTTAPHELAHYHFDISTTPEQKAKIIDQIKKEN